MLNKIICLLLGHIGMYQAIAEGEHSTTSYGGRHYCARCSKTFAVWYLSGKPSPFLLEKVISPQLKYGYRYLHSQPETWP